MSTPGPRLASGRAADVYELGDGRVLRRYRPHSAGSFDARREAETMAYLRGCGYPVPRVDDATSTDIVMERITGPLMLHALGRRPWLLDRYARQLAALHDTLHAIPPPPWLDAPFGPGTSPLHMDLHPENILITANGPVVIDWQNAVAGPPGADVAKTWIILGTAGIPGSALRRIALGPGRRLFLARFLAAVDRAGAAACLDTVAAAWIANPRTTDVERARVVQLLAKVRP